MILPIEVEGRIYEFGQVVELELETACAYAHALIPEEDEQHGGDEQGHSGH